MSCRNRTGIAGLPCCEDRAYGIVFHLAFHQFNLFARHHADTRFYKTCRYRWENSDGEWWDRTVTINPKHYAPGTAYQYPGLVTTTTNFYPTNFSFWWPPSNLSYYERLSEETGPFSFVPDVTWVWPRRPAAEQWRVTEHFEYTNEYTEDEAIADLLALYNARNIEDIVQPAGYCTSYGDTARYENGEIVVHEGYPGSWGFVRGGHGVELGFHPFDKIRAGIGIPNGYSFRVGKYGFHSGYHPAGGGFSKEWNGEQFFYQGSRLDCGTSKWAMLHMEKAKVTIVSNSCFDLYTAPHWVTGPSHTAWVATEIQPTCTNARIILHDEPHPTCPETFGRAYAEVMLAPTLDAGGKPTVSQMYRMRENCDLC